VSSDGPFDLSTRASQGLDRRPFLDEDEKVTIACRCGAVATVRWNHREPLACFVCRRAFEPPPHVMSSPRIWRPEEATPVAPADLVRARRRTALAVAFGVLALAHLIALGIWLLLEARAQ